MEYNSIEALLEKYWEAETSIQEEKELKNFFEMNASGLPPNIEKFRSHFVFLNETSEVQLSDDFMEKLNAEILSSEKSEMMILVNKEEKDFSKQKRIISINWKMWTSIAATLLLFLAGVLYTQVGIQSTKNPQYACVMVNNVEICDTEKALEITKKALGMLSKNLKKGNKHIRHVKQFGQSAKFFKKPVKEIR